MGRREYFPKAWEIQTRMYVDPHKFYYITNMFFYFRNGTLVITVFVLVD